MSSSSTSEYQVLGRVAGGLAHDLNNHLSPILLGVQTLQRHDPDEKTLRILVMIEQAARKASDLLRNVLEFSRAARITDASISRNDVVALLMDHTQSTLGTSSGIRMHDNTSWYVHTDAEVIMMIVSALTQNALEAGSDSNNVSIELRFVPATERSGPGAWTSPHDRVELIVRDKGAGMSGDVLPLATHPFFTTRMSSGHSGLGLFLAHTLVKQLNGTLNISSAENEGTEVRILLPVASSPRETQRLSD
ncbi:MAG: sensor histidine kinase [Candidatus Kapaibacterium sp.]|jgi:signal transduction histidine kinase